MRKFTFVALAAVLVGAVSAQQLYTPNRNIADQGISVKGWGSGTISQTEEMAYDGAYSLRVSTRNFFQGGLVNFAKAVDLTKAAGDKNNMIQFMVRVSNASTTLGGGGGASGRFGGGGGAGTVGGGGDDPGGRQGGGDPRSGGAGQTPSTGASFADVPISQVRMIVTTSDGKKSEAYMNVNATTAKQTWLNVAFPLAAINGFERTNKQIVSLGFSGDATATFYVGDIRVVNDSTPIQGDMNKKDAMNLALGDEVEFIGSGYGGATQLKFLWDFDAADGIQVDSEGQFVKRKFRKPGTYTVTLTIADANGVKKSDVKTVKITVNP